MNYVVICIFYRYYQELESFVKMESFVTQSSKAMMGHSLGFIGLCCSLGVSGGRLPGMKDTLRMGTDIFCCRMLKVKM